MLLNIRRNLLVVFLLASFLVAGVWMVNQKQIGKNENLDSLELSSLTPSTVRDREIIRINLADREIYVEVVTSPESITQGLSGRREIGSDGMLFLFPNTLQPHFWMKDMQFDLDFIWLKNGEVVGVTENVLHPDLKTPLNELPQYSPDVPVDAVLEVEAGKVLEWGIENH